MSSSFPYFITANICISNNTTTIHIMIIVAMVLPNIDAIIPATEIIVGIKIRIVFLTPVF